MLILSKNLCIRAVILRLWNNFLLSQNLESDYRADSTYMEFAGKLFLVFTETLSLL